MYFRFPSRWWAKLLVAAADHKDTLSPILISYTYLGLLVAAEVITIFADPLIGLLFYSSLLIALFIHSSRMLQHPLHDLLLSLALIPIIRLLSLSLPLQEFPEVYWHAIIGIPLLSAALLTIRNLNRSRAAVGLNFSKFPLQLIIMGIGVPIGYGEYQILQPDPLLEWTHWREILVPSLTLLIGTGFAEELIFRGIMQHSAVDVMGKSGIIFVSILFAALHIGFESTTDVLFIFGIGLVFGWLVLVTKSILGVTLAHGLTNIVLFLLLPHSNGVLSLDAFTK